MLLAAVRRGDRRRRQGASRDFQQPASGSSLEVSKAELLLRWIKWSLEGGTPTLAVVSDREICTRLLSAGGEVKLGMEGPGGGGGESRGGGRGGFNFCARF